MNVLKRLLTASLVTLAALTPLHAQAKDSFIWPGLSTLAGCPGDYADQAGIVKKMGR